MKSIRIISCIVAVLSLGIMATEQTTFDSANDAAKSLVEAVKAKDKEKVMKMFGDAAKEIANPDHVEAARDWAEFARFASITMNVAVEGDQAILNIGPQNWPFPVPIKKKDGKWYFDTAAGKEEILNRRIGENELTTIASFRQIVEAQRDYYLRDANGDGVVEYAARLRSTPGKKDGLYWETKPEDKPSPLAKLAESAFGEGYSKDKPESPEPFHGYFFKLITKQGAKAPGGAYDYMINGHLLGGFALLAYPAEFENSGVMTFIVNQNGKIYQKNLGEKTKELVKTMDTYEPDETWAVTKD